MTTAQGPSATGRNKLAKRRTPSRIGTGIFRSGIIDERIVDFLVRCSMVQIRFCACKASASPLPNGCPNQRQRLFDKV